MSITKEKILFFVPLPPPVTGAALRNQSLVRSQILNQSFTIKVIPFNFADEVEDIGRLKIGKLFKAISRAITISKNLILFRPDLVYFNFSLYGVALYRDFFFVILFKIFRSKLLFHLRTQGIKKQVEHSRIKRSMFSFVFKNTNIICLSNFLCQDVIDVYSGTPIVVNNGIEDVALQFPPMKRESNDPVRIFYLGHLWKFKGILDLIRALHQLKLSGANFEAIIAGPEGDLKYPELNEQLEKLDLKSKVKIVGEKNGEEKYMLFSKSDIFVLPTHFEAFPGTILEAMQFGLPVIGTFEGAIPEIIDDGVTGLLVKKMDINGLATGLHRLLDDPDLRSRMGIAGRQKYLLNYQVKIFENNMKQAFLKVLKLH